MAGRVAYYGNIVKNGLILDMDAAKRDSYPGTGTAWNDISGFQYNGTLTNGPTFNSANGGSIVFDGTNDYVITTLNQTPSLNITSTITLESWIKSTAIANASHGDGIFSKGTSSDSNSGVYETVLINISGINYPFFRMRIGSSTPTYSPTNIPITLNQPYHIVSTYNGSTLRIFVNGVESGTGLSASGNIEANTQQLAIGVRYLSLSVATDSYFSGNIFLNRIYNRALSAAEVLQNYNATKGRYI
jgi:hypothetical protein